MSDMGRAEKWRQTLDDVIARYRAHLAGKVDDQTLTLEQALEKLRALDLTDGESLRYLTAPKRR